MNFKINLIVFLFCMSLTAQVKDTTAVVYKKKVLEATEVDFLASYYTQKGVHSAVAGGIGSEALTDFASNVIVAVPLNEDDVLTVNAGLSAYTSASSSNINPFNGNATTVASSQSVGNAANGNPWQASSGASASDMLVSLSGDYSHSSDDRNTIYDFNVAFSNEYDYTSIGFGGGISRLFNDKNSEISAKAKVYLDQWRPIYPTELSEYGKYGVNFQNQGYFSGATILDANGDPSTSYLPSNFSVWDKTNRNSYALSLGFSQVATQKMQFSFFLDVLYQQGMLSTPYQRVYFADKANYFVGNGDYIPVYTTANNLGVYQLADDIERLPGSRFKLPFGARFNYYINETITLRTYYRYYWDNWDINSHTMSVELPFKLSSAFTIYPMYRYYTQNQSKYFAPFETHLSTEKFYTSDYDLSTFVANQYGFGLSYTDIFMSTKIFKFGIKNIDFRYNYYNRTDGLTSNIFTLGVKFVNQ